MLPFAKLTSSSLSELWADISISLVNVCDTYVYVV